MRRRYGLVYGRKGGVSWGKDHPPPQPTSGKGGARLQRVSKKGNRRGGSVDNMAGFRPTTARSKHGRKRVQDSKNARTCAQGRAKSSAGAMGKSTMMGQSGRVDKATGPNRQGPSGQRVEHLEGETSESAGNDNPAAYTSSPLSGEMT